MIKIISAILFLPHLLLFQLSKKKQIIKHDLYSRTKIKSNPLIVHFDLSSRLFSDRYFRTLFYFRIGGFVTKILRIFYPKDNYFIIDIHTVLGKGVQLAHPYATILNAATIGDNLYINHLVTVGEKNGLKPKIGNNVQLNAGCIIIGDINIGDNVVVGAGAVVVKSVPENAIVVGNPGRVIGYINH